ncbi:MAG: hypothetical protein C4576_03765 [Desulfobacteraceae bacterium]|nr:MAG: hypothetical protein C4576_03765 [Desulfobacteraceae bacterium]
MRRSAVSNPFIRISAAIILGVSWVVSCQQVLYAAHLPGDSFTAAVFLLIPLMLQFVVLGREEGSRRLPPQYFFRTMMGGLSLLAVVGFSPMLSGKKFLESIKLTIFGHKLSSTAFFEIGVFLIIVGVVTYGLVTFKEPD